MNFKEYLEESKDRYYKKDIKNLKLKGDRLALVNGIVAIDGSINSFGVDSIKNADDKSVKSALQWFKEVSVVKFDGWDFANIMRQLKSSYKGK